MKIRKGDTVRIIGGDDKGKTGKVIAALPYENKIMAEGIRMIRKHTRARRQGQKGEVIQMPAFFRASRAMLVCPACGKPARFGAGMQGNKKSYRCKRCGAEK